MKRKGPDCFECVHFHITWDKHFPYGCRAMGFKTRGMPSEEVLRASGEHCLRYGEKTGPSARKVH